MLAVDINIHDRQGSKSLHPTDPKDKAAYTKKSLIHWQQKDCGPSLRTY